MGWAVLVKVIRILLQLVIVGAGGLVLAALIYHPSTSLLEIVIFFGFLVFLFSLTLFLNEHTKERLIENYRPNLRFGGVAVFLLGSFGLFYGMSYLLGSQELPDGTGRCRGICSFILLATDIFGELIGKAVAFFIWSALGIFLCVVGYKVINEKTR